MKKFIATLCIAATLAIPALAANLSLECGTGMFNSINTSTKINDQFSVNAGIDYKALSINAEIADIVKTSANGAIYMPKVGLDYTFISNEKLDLSFGTNVTFIIPSVDFKYSNDSDTGSQAMEDAVNESIDETLKKFSSMALDIYVKAKYNVSEQFGFFSKASFQGLGATYKEDYMKTGLGMQGITVTSGFSYTFQI